jgi:hypothetical protein
MIGMLSEIGKYIDEDGNPIDENPILTTQHLRGIPTISNLLSDVYPMDEDGNPILTTQHLRSMSTISNLLYIGVIVDEIRNGVIESAFTGKTNTDFTIMCIRSQHTICENYDGYLEWWRQYILRNGGELIPKNNIQSEQIKTRVIQKIQNAFPDSNITKGYKKCCDTYNITW